MAVTPSKIQPPHQDCCPVTQHGTAGFRHHHGYDMCLYQGGDKILYEYVPLSANNNKIVAKMMFYSSTVPVYGCSYLSAEGFLTLEYSPRWQMFQMLSRKPKARGIKALKQNKNKNKNINLTTPAAASSRLTPVRNGGRRNIAR